MINMYPKEINPKCSALSNPNNEPILDGDSKRILEICNSGDISLVPRLLLLVPERKLDGYVPPHASPIYEDETFADSALEFLEDHNDYDGDDYMPFEGIIYDVVVEGFVCKIVNSVTIKEQCKCD